MINLWVGTIAEQDYWTGLLTGLTQTAKKCLVQCKTEAKRTYSLSYFAP